MHDTRCAPTTQAESAERAAAAAALSCDDDMLGITCPSDRLRAMRQEEGFRFRGDIRSKGVILII